jgi:hypothetical protein
MLEIWLELQSERVEPDVPFLIHLMPKTFGTIAESYCELINKTLFSIELQAFSKKKHLYYSPSRKRLQTFRGVF